MQYRIISCNEKWVIQSRAKSCRNWIFLAEERDILDTFKHLPSTAGHNDKAVFYIEVVDAN